MRTAQRFFSVGAFRLQSSALAWMCLTASACPAPEPFYDDDIGEEGVPVDVGALAGTWAVKSLNAQLITIPVLGREEIGGGVNLRLVDRTWDSDAQVYRQSSRLCGGYNFEVAGVTTIVPQDTYRAVPRSTEETVTVDHETGRYEAIGNLQLWAFQNLPDPYTTDLPDDLEQALQPPHDDRVYDMDDDGELGFTTFVDGAVVGEQYVAQRKTLDLLGVTRSADRVFGLADNASEIIYLGNNNTLLDRRDEGATEQHPDPKEAWFDEIRVDQNTDCDDVVSLDDDGTLARLRPFAR